jgi:glycosyltransferase involved in cell wall biosynthesis
VARELLDEDDVMVAEGNETPVPELSIITPTFNGGAYIERCVECVIDQGVADRIEHIVLDGASADGSAELLDELSRRWPHLRFVSEPDRGQSHALNKGMRLARAPVVGILNVDDTYEPGALKRVLELFDGVAEPAFIVGNCNMRRADGSIWFVNRPRWLRPWQLLLGVELVKFPLNPSAYFYHRSLHDLIGPYDENEHYAMDLDFILRVAQRIRIRYVDEAWGNFCLGPHCKTVVGGESGLSIPQREAVYARHLANLPLVQRIPVSMIAAASRSKPCDVLRFVVQRPDLAWRRFVHHLRHAVERVKRSTLRR